MGFILLCVGGASAAFTCCGCCKAFAKYRLAKVIEKVGTKALAGARVELRGIRIKMGADTTVSLRGLKVHNLPGFESDHVLHAQCVSATIHTAGVVRSAWRAKGKPTEVSVSVIRVDGLSFFYERTLTTSNINALQKALKKKNNINACPPTAAAPGQGVPGPRSMTTRIGFVETDNITLRIATSHTIKQGLPPAVVHLAPMRFENFSEQHKVKSADAMVRFLIETTLWTLLKHVVVLADMGRDCLAVAVVGAAEASGHAMLGMKDSSVEFVANSGDVCHHVAMVLTAAGARVGNERVRDVAQEAIAAAEKRAAQLGGTGLDITWRFWIWLSTLFSTAAMEAASGGEAAADMTRLVSDELSHRFAAGISVA